eukprot:3824582-Amphidinium_carterae.1
MQTTAIGSSLIKQPAIHHTNAATLPTPVDKAAGTSPTSETGAAAAVAGVGALATTTVAPSATVPSPSNKLAKSAMTTRRTSIQLDIAVELRDY